VVLRIPVADGPMFLDLFLWETWQKLILESLDKLSFSQVWRSATVSEDRGMCRRSVGDLRDILQGNDAMWHAGRGR
jgi:hypothetical protein